MAGRRGGPARHDADRALRRPADAGRRPRQAWHDLRRPRRPQQGYVSAFAVAKAGIARLTELLACELAGTQVRVPGVHPGFVRTAMTEQLAWGEQGRAWLPGFGETAERRWADAQPAADLITAIALGAADQLTGRILHPRDDDLSALTRQCQSQPGRRRLRLDLS